MPPRAPEACRSRSACLTSLARVAGLVALGAAALLPRVAWADDVVHDPELEGLRPPRPATQAVPAPVRGPGDTTWRITLRSRWGIAPAAWNQPSLDLVEGTSIASVEVEQRRSDALILNAGLRLRQDFGVQKNGQVRSELDATPLSAFADVTPAAGFHFRAGYQVLTMGRFDLFSATNFLAAYDLRSGPATMPEAAPIAQPALRFDLDRVRGFTLQAYYVPVFTPDRVTLYGSNSALLAPLDRAIDKGQLGDAAASTRASFVSALGRSGLATGSSAALSALAPPPDFTKPQGALRATLHGTAGELAATVGTALEAAPPG